MRAKGEGRSGGGVAGDGGPVGIEADDAAGAAGSRSRSAVRVTSTGAPASASMKARRPWRVVGIERQVGAAGLEDAEQGDHHLERALDAQPDHHLGADPEAAADDGPADWRGASSSA